MRQCICVFVALLGVCVCSCLLLAETVGPNGQPIEISTVADSTNSASAEMMNAFREKIASHSNLFSLVPNLDDSSGLVFEAGCKSREQSNDAYVCFYTSYFAGGIIRTPLGSGMYASKSADDVANNLLALMAQDLAERWNSTMWSNAIKIVESCLSSTSSCTMPFPLTPELRTKVLNLAQSLQKGELKK
jgi:hypothetical protein